MSAVNLLSAVTLGGAYDRAGAPPSSHDLLQARLAAAATA